MNEDNEFEWRRHLLTALDGLSKKIDENSAEHVNIRAEIASIRNDLTAVKATDPDKKLSDYVQSSRGWRMVIVGQAVTILISICSMIWWGGTINERVINIKANQINITKDVDDLKITSIGYREWRTTKQETNK